MIQEEIELPFSAQLIYEVLTDFEHYPDFMEGISALEVLKSSKTKATCRYHLNLVKSFTYELEHVLKKDKEVSWSFLSGDFLKKNNGSWKLKAIDDECTHITYELDVAFKMMVPSMVSKKLMKTSLPNLFKGLERECQRRSKKANS